MSAALPTTSSLSSSNHLHVGTWNVQTLDTQTNKHKPLECLLDVLDNLRLHIVAVQETKQTGVKQLDVGNWWLLNSGSPNKSEHGSGFFVSKSVWHMCIDWRAHGERICSLRIRFADNDHLTVISVYAPTNSATASQKDAFYAKLQRVWTAAPVDDVKLIVGDLNAQIRRTDVDTSSSGGLIGTSVSGTNVLHMDKDWTDNGIRLVNFAKQNELVISSTIFERDALKTMTWIRCGGPDHTQIDHALIATRHNQRIECVSSETARSARSDHFILHVNYKATVTQPPQFERIRYNLAMLDVDSAFPEAITAALRLQPEWTAELSVTEQWQQLLNLLVDISKRLLTFAYKTGTDENVLRADWFNQDCHVAYSELQSLSVDFLQSHIAGSNLKGKSLKKLLNEKKKEKNELVEDSFHSYNELCNFIRTEYFTPNERVPMIHPLNLMTQNVIDISNDRNIIDTDCLVTLWRTQFADVFGGHTTNGGESLPTEVSASMFEELTPNFDDEHPPTYAEVLSAIDHLQVLQPCIADNDGISVEILKASGELFGRRLHKLMQNIWRKRQLPDCWRTVWIHPECLPLANNCGQPYTNYYAKAQLNTANHLLSNILYDRLLKHVEPAIGAYQCVRQPTTSIHQPGGSPSSEEQFVMRLLCDKCSMEHKTVYHQFLGFDKKTIDKLDHRVLYEIMGRLQVCDSLVAMVRSTLEETKAVVQWHGKQSEPFAMPTGLKWGDCLTPLLLNLLVEWVLRQTGQLITHNVVAHESQVLAFGDRLLVLGRTKDTLTDVLHCISEAAEKCGLTIVELSSVDKSISTPGEQYITDKISKATNQLEAELALLYEDHLHPDQILELCVRYMRQTIRGCETWNLSSRIKHELGAFEEKLINRIGASRQALSQSAYQDIVASVRCARIRWLCDVKANVGLRSFLQQIQGYWNVYGNDEADNSGRPRDYATFVPWTDEMRTDLNELRVEWDDAVISGVVTRKTVLEKAEAKWNQFRCN